MLLKNVDNYFSKMNWLEEEIKYGNKLSKSYYDLLKTIKEKQNNGIVSIEVYKLFGGRRKELQTPEYGYFTANIHYDLFHNKDEKKLKERINYFINSIGDKFYTDEYSWFILNYKRLLEK